MVEDSNSPVDSSAEKTKLSELPNVVSLPDAGDMDSEGAYGVMRAAPTRIILCAGPANSGKTTILGRIYESFQHGPFAGLEFAGSATLHGFERRCHLARAASGRSTPDMEHTPTSLGLRFLHLRVRELAGDRCPVDILLADLGGEFFEAAKNSDDACRGLKVIARSDVFALLIDGGCLVDKEKRADAVASSMSLLRRCIESEMLRSHATVDVVFSKYDLLKSGDQGADQYTDYIQEEFKRRFDGRVGTLRFHRVAAIATRRSGMTSGFGLDKAFGAWARGPAMAEQSRLGASPRPNDGTRMYLRFQCLSGS